jgi:DNA repair protein RadC
MVALYRPGRRAPSRRDHSIVDISGFGSAPGLWLTIAMASGDNEHAFAGEVRDRETALRLFAPIATLTREVAVFAYLDRDWRLLGMRHGPAGARHSAMIPVREVTRDVLAFEARLVLMAHNHPSGDPNPSQDDVAATRRLARTLAAIGVSLIDHLVLAGTRNASLRAAGLL